MALEIEVARPLTRRYAPGDPPPPISELEDGIDHLRGAAAAPVVLECGDLVAYPLGAILERDHNVRVLLLRSRVRPQRA